MGAPEREEHGLVTLILGCMFSGKTTALLRQLRQADSAGVLAIKPGIDRRYSDTQIVTHSGQAFPAKPVAGAAEVLGMVDASTQFVGIDEAHFFDEELVDVVSALRGRRIDVVLTALDRSSWGRLFRVVEGLRAISDEFALVYAVCARCGRRADHTQRLTPIIGTNLVGGPESYEPRCAACWRPPPEPEPR